jgi:hypothetical protein
MTIDRNKLLELAKEAGCALDQRYKGEVTFISHDALERFAALLQAQGEPQSLDQVWNEAIEAAATECNRTMMFPGGRQESYAHHGVDAAATAIRSLKRPSQAQERDCETCEGKGTIDEQLGGYAFSNPEAKCPDCDGRGWHPASVSGAVDELTKALRFYADPERYRGSNNRLVGEDHYTPSGEVYLRDVMRDGGEIARAALSRAQATQPAQTKGMFEILHAEWDKTQPAQPAPAQEDSRDAARWRYVEKSCYLKSTAGIDGPIVHHRLDIPADFETQDVGAAVDREIEIQARSDRWMAEKAAALAQAGKEKPVAWYEKPLTRCAASRGDGECFHTQCPQLRDGEPKKSGRHCPLDTQEDGDE